MKKNAILLASIMFIAAGCAHQGGSARYDSGSSSSPEASIANFSTENPIRNPDGSLQMPASIAAQHDPGNYSDFDVSTDTSTQTDIIRARGEEPYSSSENSAAASTSGLRETAAPSRGFTIESGLDSGRDDFGQGTSATWESEKANGSVRGWANWNASDDLLPDGVFTDTPELNNDASVGGAATSEVGQGSSDESSSPGEPEDGLKKDRDSSRSYDVEDAPDEPQSKQ